MTDAEALRSVCQDIYDITGIKPVIYDASMHIVYSHPLSMGEFCRQVRMDPARRSRCLDCDRAGFAQCRNTGELFIYRCHMGLTEAAAPIVDRGTVIGYLLFGQLLEEQARDQIRQRLLHGDFANRELLLELLEQMDPTEPRIIASSARLMAMCASYIRLQHVLKRQHKDLALSIADYISQNYAQDLSICQLCRQFGISRGTLYTISKNAFGMGITDYIRSCRINAAIELLQSGDLPVCRVAEAVGISDANYLTKLIKTQTGMTPKQLQRHGP